MDLSFLDPAGNRTLELIGAVPDTVWAALVSAVVTLGLAAGLLARRPVEAGDGALPGEEPPACDFLVNGSSLRPLTGAARALIEGLGGRSAPLQALVRISRRTARRSPTTSRPSSSTARRSAGTASARTAPPTRSPAGPRGGAAILSIRPATAEIRALDAAERALAREQAEAAFLREALDRAPILAWTRGPDGQLAWTNAAYRDRFDRAGEVELAAGRHSCGFAHLLEEVPLTARIEGESRRRVRVAASADGDPRWFELSEIALPSGETLAYASEADDLVAAEASLRRFVETLTETFAHLPIGLAVFDKNRRLGLFNPALSDLVKIDAVWLAGRPSLRDFLERLRETRQMPEQKDFAAFRRMLTELEEGARDGTYEENWVLPSGKIFRVTGRPHPQGALAFLFEDISTSIQLERRYRSELELSQSTLDRMAEAVAVFDTSGMLVFVNSAFETLWGLDPMASLEGPTVAELTRLWQERCLPTTLWADLRGFATGADNRTSWTGAAATLDGRGLTVLVAPLPNGSTLVTFRDRVGFANPALAGPAAAPGGGLRRASVLSGLALAELEAPAEAALAALAAAIGAAPTATAFAGLTQAAGGLKDGLARARSLQERAERAAGAEDDATAASLADRMGALLAARGLALGAVIETGPAPDGAGADAPFADALPGLAMAAAALAAPGAALELAVDRTAEGGVLSLHLPDGAATASPDPESHALALARRRLEAAAPGSKRASAPRAPPSPPASHRPSPSPPSPRPADPRPAARGKPRLTRRKGGIGGASAAPPMRAPRSSGVVGRSTRWRHVRRGARVALLRGRRAGVRSGGRAGGCAGSRTGPRGLRSAALSRGASPATHVERRAGRRPREPHHRASPPRGNRGVRPRPRPAARRGGCRHPGGPARRRQDGARARADRGAARRARPPGRDPEPELHPRAGLRPRRDRALACRSLPARRPVGARGARPRGGLRHRHRPRRMAGPAGGRPAGAPPRARPRLRARRR
jgi:PAS domain-containing protein